MNHREKLCSVVVRKSVSLIWKSGPGAAARTVGGVVQTDADTKPMGGTKWFEGLSLPWCGILASGSGDSTFFRIVEQ